MFLLKEYPSFGLDKFCAEIKKRATRASAILSSIPDLRKVTISWVDTTRTGEFKTKATLVEPLKILQHRVEFSLGEISGLNLTELPSFIREIQACLGPNVFTDGNLAYDMNVRQAERHDNDALSYNVVPEIDT